MATRSGKHELAAFSLALVPYMVLVRGFWWVDEDAFISFRFAYNLAHGAGLRFNLGEHVPVEGYSNFLWVLWSGLIEFLGGDVTFWVPLTSAVAEQVRRVDYEHTRGQFGEVAVDEGLALVPPATCHAHAVASRARFHDDFLDVAPELGRLQH